MRRHRPVGHPLEPLFEGAALSLTTALSDGTVCAYRATLRNFLRYLGAQHHEICRLEQLRRDPHILGWLTELRSHTPPLSKSTLILRIVFLHRLLEQLAWSKQTFNLSHLITREDVPRREKRLPRPLLPEQDEGIQQELLRRNDLASNLLLLQRHTGMRIGECVDLAADCLHPIGPDQWAIHVPLGKLKTERLVPVDPFVCQIIGRLLGLRSQSNPEPGPFLLPRNRSRETLIRKLRASFRHAVAAAGIHTRLVPHQSRHTYATEMLRSGVTLTGVMELLGHTSPEMTLLYLEITQPDLQREYHLAREHPRHQIPCPQAPRSSASFRADLPSLLSSLHTARYVLEMFRRALPDGNARRHLDRVGNRLSKMIAQLRNLGPAE
jgi:site-specific recombinase XerD